MRFLEAGSHVELFFLMSDAGDATMFPAPPGVERDVIARSIRQQVAQSKSYGVLHIVEAWSYIRRQEKDHTYRQIMEGEIGVSNLKAEDKTEALMVAMETRDGHSLTMLSPILRGKDEVALADEIEFTEPNEGRYSGWFRIVGKQNER
jgi:hypothetical protein